MTATARLRPGDIVTVTIAGPVAAVDPADPARIAVRATDGTLIWVRPDVEGRPATTRAPASIVTCALVATREWPPLPGETWADRDGREWKASEHDPEHRAEATGPVLTCEELGDWYCCDYGLGKASRNYGPFRLVTPSPLRDRQEEPW